MTHSQVRKCVPCEGIGEPLNSHEVEAGLKKLPHWQASGEQKAIQRDFIMKNFMAAVRFIHKVAELAEHENHHPDIHLTEYRKLRIALTTHAVGGITKNDFILAEMIDALPVELKQ